MHLSCFIHFLSQEKSDCGSPSGAGFYMEDGDIEKYHATSVIQDCVFLSRKGGCFRCMYLQVYNKNTLYLCNAQLFKRPLENRQNKGLKAL